MKSTEMATLYPKIEAWLAGPAEMILATYDPDSREIYTWHGMDGWVSIADGGAGDLLASVQCAARLFDTARQFATWALEVTAPC